MQTINVAIDSLGTIFGFVFIYLNIKSLRSIVGSIFKRYHQWMIVGASCFTLGFLSDIDFTSFLGINTGAIGESMHDIFLLAAAIIFVFTNLYLPKEAANYMEQQKPPAA